MTTTDDLALLRRLSQEEPPRAGRSGDERSYEFCATCAYWLSEDGQMGECDNSWAMKWSRGRGSDVWDSGCTSWDGTGEMEYYLQVAHIRVVPPDPA